MIKTFNIICAILAFLAICLSCSRTATKQAAPKPQTEFDFSKDFEGWRLTNSADTVHEFSFGPGSGYDNVPNIFGGGPIIWQFALPQPCSVSVEICDATQKKLGTLELGYNQSGRYGFKWRATKAPSGIYFLIFHACDFSDTRKYVFMK